jgi:4-amino-4-deoxy-L-arabinose transferase-like glycosyltransferase
MSIEGSLPAAAARDAAAGRPYGALLIAALAALTAARLLWLALSGTDLYPDEAQYWFWAQHPAFGYYSKPPLIAWLIALTTGLFGDGEFAVRLAAPLLQAAAAGFVYAIAARLYDRRTGFWSGLAYASLPGVSAAAVIVSTDGPLLVCWAAALYAFIRARERGSPRWWVAVGIALGLGLLAKYAMVYWLLSALGFVILDRSERRHLRPLMTAIALGLALYAPNLWWNWTDGFVSYLHTRDNADLGGILFHPAAFLEFALSQFGVFGPLFAAALLWLAVRPRLLAEPRARLLAAFALPTLALVLALSLLSRAHANWAAPAYVSAVVLVVALPLRAGWRRVLVLSVALNIAAALVVLGGGGMLAAAGVALPAKYDPLHRLRGWRRLGAAVGAALHRHPGLMLLADDRETLAALIYYVRPHPFDAAKWRLGHRITDQWDLENGLDKYRGRSFLLVSQHDLIAQMRPSFAAIDKLRAIAIPIGPHAARRYTLYVARDFRGYRR